MFLKLFLDAFSCNVPYLADMNHLHFITKYAHVLTCIHIGYLSFNLFHFYAQFRFYMTNPHLIIIHSDRNPVIHDSDNFLACIRNSKIAL